MDLRKEKSKPDQERTEPIRSDRAEVVSESKLQRTRSFAKINPLNQPYLSPGGMKTQSSMFLQQQTCDSMTKCNTKKKTYIYSFLNTYYPFECLVLKVYKYIALYIISPFHLQHAA